jgi:nicotinate-nucleotide adenylyltransferase
MSTPRIGILGGTFDPIHRGHADLAHAASEALALTRMIVIPANIPPHRPQPFASSYHRFAMAALAVAGRPDWRVSDLELRTEAPSYTTMTLKRFHERGYAPSELFFLIGADAFADIMTWKDSPHILGAAHFVVVSRPGCAVSELPRRLPQLAARMIRPPLDARASVEPLIILIDAQTPDVSSTAIRRRLAEHQTITGMVDPGVQQHIEQHGLYAPAIPGRRRGDESFISSAGRLHGQN